MSSTSRGWRSGWTAASGPSPRVPAPWAIPISQSRRDPNLLLRIAADGTIFERIALPDAVNALQVRFGFEGVAVTGAGSSELVYVAFQREWARDPDNMVRIGRFDPNEPNPDAAWSFFYFEIKDPTTPNPDPGFV